MKRSPLKRRTPLRPGASSLKRTVLARSGAIPRKPMKKGTGMAVAYGKGAKGKATRLHAELVRSRGACERCGSTEQLQCAHIIGRSFSATRTDETNGWCLCASCHRHLTNWPHEHVAFAHATIGEPAFRALCEKARSNPRPWPEKAWQAEVARLTALLAAVSGSPGDDTT